MTGRTGERARKETGRTGERARKETGRTGERARKVTGRTGEWARKVTGHTGERGFTTGDPRRREKPMTKKKCRSSRMALFFLCPHGAQNYYQCSH